MYDLVTSINVGILTDGCYCKGACSGYGDILHYTGMGKIGNQDINHSQNRILSESKGNGISVYPFEVLIAKQYISRGQVELVDESYQEVQSDDE